MSAAAKLKLFVVCAGGGRGKALVRARTLAADEGEGSQCPQVPQHEPGAGNDSKLNPGNE